MTWTTRRRRAIASLATAALAVAATGCNWAQPRYDAGHSGVNAGERALTVTTVAGLEEAWSVDGLRGPGDVAVVNGTAVVAETSGLRAYDARTGASRWTVDLLQGIPIPDWPYAPPAVTDPTVVGKVVRVGVLVYGASFVPNNSVRGYDLATGAPVAQVPEDAPAAPTGATLTHGAGWLWGSFAIFTGGGGSFIYGASGVSLAGDRMVIADNPDGGSSAVAIGGGQAAYGTPQGELAAVDAAGEQGCTLATAVVWRCEPLWSVPVGVVETTPVIRDGVVYATTDTGLFALTLPDAPTGAIPQPLWSAAVAGGTAPAVTGDGDAYVGSSTDGGRLEAYTGADCPYGADCAPTWVGPTGGPVTAAPTVAGDVVYVVAGDQVSAFAAAGCGADTCPPLWSTTLPGPAESPATVVNGRVYVSTPDAVVAYALAA